MKFTSLLFNGPAGIACHYVLGFPSIAHGHGPLILLLILLRRHGEIEEYEIWPAWKWTIDGVHLADCVK